MEDFLLVLQDEKETCCLTEAQSFNMDAFGEKLKGPQSKFVTHL